MHAGGVAGWPVPETQAGRSLLLEEDSPESGLLTVLQPVPVAPK